MLLTSSPSLVSPSGLSAVCGPTLGPLIGGWAFQGTQDWRWTIWPILFASGGALILLFFTLPETSSTNILVRRAKRLRKLTGNDELRSAGEVAQAQMTGREVAMMTLVRPFLLTAVEPMVFLLNLQIGLVYAILYAWLEAFPLVFMGAYGFNSGELGLAFLSLFIGAVLTYAGFVVYCKLRLEPMFDKGNGTIQPEARLEPSFFGIWWLPICLFGFGWTSTASIHWIVPMIFASFFSIGTFLAFQSVLNYLSDSYPDYVASILAGNDLFRAAMGAALPLVARLVQTSDRETVGDLLTSLLPPLFRHAASYAPFLVTEQCLTTCKPTVPRLSRSLGAQPSLAASAFSSFLFPLSSTATGPS